MGASPSIGNCVYALRELLEVSESHRAVESIQDMVNMWRNLLINSPQTSIAIGKYCDPSGFVDPAMSERKTDRAHGLRTSHSEPIRAFGNILTSRVVVKLDRGPIDNNGNFQCSNWPTAESSIPDLTIHVMFPEMSLRLPPCRKDLSEVILR